jgi:Na+-transporting NADH:ubiquinone oxidoreductase subunit F
MKIFLRKLHKWVSLAIGIQLLLWLSSGVMMAQLDPDKVSGDQWASKSHIAPQVSRFTGLLEPRQLPTEPLETVLGIHLEMNRGIPVYRIGHAGGETLLNAVDGSVISFGRQFAEQIARSDFTGKGEIESITPGQAPDMETRDSAGPYWRVNFSDKTNTSIYISASTGEILERRNSYWRVRDFFWMLHIMDYSGHENINNSIIITVALIAIWLGVSGFILLFYSFRRRDFDFLRGQRGL